MGFEDEVDFFHRNFSYINVGPPTRTSQRVNAARGLNTMDFFSDYYGIVEAF